MKYTVNSSCIGCGLCAGMCPEVFEMNSSGLAEAKDVSNPPATAQEAKNSCPVGAIEET